MYIEDLKFCYGNIIGIVGENGIGKSTLAKIICGLYKANKGKILKDDENFNIKSRLNESLLIMQEVNCQLFTDTVKDEIVLTSNIKDDNALDTWLKDMELKNISDRNPHTLSGGQKQIVIILSEGQILLFVLRKIGGRNGYAVCTVYIVVRSGCRILAFSGIDKGNAFCRDGELYLALAVLVFPQGR